MKAIAKISKKGQVVIPKEMRKSLGLRPGDYLIFVLTKEGVLLTKQKESPFDKYYGYLNKPGSSSDKLIRQMRGERNDFSH